jgi:hypothetical protein
LGPAPIVFQIIILLFMDGKRLLVHESTAAA